jgi:RimJ/RimL family protein N-acetyltransferase
MNLKVSLRPWQTNDINYLVKYANNKNVSKFLTDRFPFPYNEEDAINFLRFAQEDKCAKIFAIEFENHAVGGIGIHPLNDIFRNNAELGYWLGEPYWGRGIISEAIHQVVPLAFSLLPINRLFARPFATNIASQRVLEKNGFSLEARFEKTFIKDDELIDELVYAIRR